MKKVVIFGDLMFPFGSASANYVFYLAKAIITQSWECIVISTENEKSYNMHALNKIIFRPIKYHSKVIRHIGINYTMGLDILHEIKKIGIDSSDLIIAYSTNPYTLSTVLHYANKNKIKIAACITERLDINFFRELKNGEKRYKDYVKATESIIPKYDVVFPISRYLDGFYKNLGATTMLLPVLANVDDIEKVQKPMNKISYIFPASGSIKDALEPMIKSFIQLSKQYENRIELHLTGISQKKFEREYTDAVSSLGKSVFCHGWLDYEELIELYKKTNFLFIAREKNQVTMANFPSKVPEVMCYGVIPIASKVGDYTETFLTDGVNSIIFEGCDCASCTGALKRTLLLTQKEIDDMSKNCMETVRSKLDLHQWGRKVIDKLKN